MVTKHEVTIISGTVFGYLFKGTYMIYTFHYLCLSNTFWRFLQVNSSLCSRSTCEFEKRITLLVDAEENRSQLLIQLRFF